MSGTVPASRGRLAPLDGIRAFAVLAVLADHTNFGFGHTGFLGVDVFFVLSGYLIATILLAEQDRTGSISLRRFYSRRALRLYPALVLACLLALILIPGQVPGASVFVALAYLQDFANDLGWWHTGFGLFHTWSLAIEEQFYLLWPLFLILGSRLGRRFLIWATALGAGYGIVALWVWFTPAPPPTAPVYFRPDARVGAILLGCLLALVIERVSLPRWLAWSCVGILVACLATDQQPNTRLSLTILIPLTWLAAAGLVGSMVQGRSPTLSRLLSWRPLTWTGEISYGLYLYHWILFTWLSNLGLERRYVALLGIPATFALAAVSYYFLESPIRDLGRRPALATGSVAVQRITHMA